MNPNDLILVALGVLCAGIGGELFVLGAVGTAQWARIPAGIVGVTVAAFATSSPELFVAINAASAGKPQIALGDALGSNVVNVALILALGLLVSGMKVSQDSIRRDFALAIGTPIFTGILALDGELSRLDAILMLGVFFGWLVILISDGLRHRRNTDKHENPPSIQRMGVYIVVGLAFLVGAGRFIVTGAAGIGEALGLSKFVVGATLVAFGTSTPELATTVISNLRGHHEVGLGNILGSNIFNGLWIISVAALISPIAINARDTLIGLGFGIVVLLAAFPWQDSRIGRGRGLLLLVIYAVYLVVILSLR